MWKTLVSKITMDGTITIAALLSVFTLGIGWGININANVSRHTGEIVDLQKAVDGKADKTSFELLRQDIQDQRNDVKEIKNYLINRKGR